MKQTEGSFFEGNVALITGGNSGIGKETALVFARQGASVVISARREPEGLEVVDSIRAAGGKAEFVQTDVSDAQQVDAMISHTIESFGRLDFAFNNAAINGGVAPIHEYPHELWNDIISVNLTGTFLCMQAEIKHMMSNGGGSIVNTASINGMRATPRNLAYSTSKWGVIGMTKSAAKGYGQHGIRVNAVSPGLVDTPMVEAIFNDEAKRNEAIKEYPLGRLGQPIDIAEAVLWLCSDSASFITGVNLPVEGGFID